MFRGGQCFFSLHNNKGNDFFFLFLFFVCRRFSIFVEEQVHYGNYIHEVLWDVYLGYSLFLLFFFGFLFKQLTLGSCDFFAAVAEVVMILVAAEIPVLGSGSLSLGLLYLSTGIGVWFGFSFLFFCSLNCFSPTGNAG
jgi:hypothetical protein